MECVYNYLDDTLLSGPCLLTHLEALDKVLAAYKKAGLTLQPEKCTFFQTEVEFLGHQLTVDGISPLDRHLKIIRDWPEPTNLTELKSFLGKINYYRKSIKNSSKLAAPLTNLTSVKRAPTFTFTEEARSSFKALKEALMSAPILAFPRFDTDEKFYLDTDWSNEAIGGQLSQIQDGREVVIQYGSRKLGKYEQNLSSNKGELLAVIYFMRKWRYYLQYKPFVLRIDHEALRYIKTMDHPRGVTARWLRTLSDFEFQVEFRKSSQHANGDALSRLPNAPSPTSKDEEFFDEKLFSLEACHRLDMAKAQQEDPVLRHVHTWLCNKKKPTAQDIRHLDENVKHYHALFETAIQRTLRIYQPSERQTAVSLPVCTFQHGLSN